MNKILKNKEIKHWSGSLKGLNELIKDNFEKIHVININVSEWNLGTSFNLIYQSLR